MSRKKACPPPADPNAIDPCVTRRTKCDLDTRANIWMDRGSPPDESRPGACMLDTMSKEQVIYVLQHRPDAAQQLLKITSDPELRALAGEIDPLPSVELVDMEQEEGNATQDTAPFYSVFRGQPPFAQ